MKLPANRVLLAFKAWEDRKKEMEPVLKAGNTDATTLAKLQLDHLRQANHRLRDTVRPDEKPFMALLHHHISKLEMQLYPNRLLRLFSKLKDRLMDGPAYLKQQAVQRASNMENLKKQLRESGLGSVSGTLEKHLEPEQQQVRLPLDCQLNEGKRLSFDLHFQKDAYGNFQLHRLDGSLFAHNQLVKSHQFELTDWPGLGTNHVWSLLEGRAMKQQFIDASGHQNQRWVALGPNGAQHYAPDHAFDVKAMVESMANLKGSKPEMIRYIENGQSAPALWKVDRQYQNIYVQADPANKGLKFFDNKNKPITPEKLNQNAMRLAPGVKILGAPVQNTRKKLKNGQHL